jgi:hypothetical protein
MICRCRHKAGIPRLDRRAYHPFTFVVFADLQVKKMVPLMYFTLAVSVAIGISASGAQTNGESRSNVQSITAVVKAVSASFLTVEHAGNEMTFGVDSSTRVLTRARAVARPDLLLRPGQRQGRRITDVVKTGDKVTVRYRQSGSAMTAVEVVEVQPAPK